jgi:cell division protein ZapA
MSSDRVVPVEIQGHRYPIKSALDPAYVARLAGYVDEKMKAASDSSNTGDPLRLAIIAALNIADELFRSQDDDRAWQGAVSERAGQIEKILDRILAAP